MTIYDISSKRITADKFVTLVEIPKGSKAKYEIDEETGLLSLDRVLSTSTHYPWNYGFIPKTYAFDEDPLDVLLLCSEALFPNVLVECKPIGLLKMIDGGDQDDKVIAVATNDLFFNGLDNIDQLPKHIIDEIRHFFSVYKALEGKITEPKEILGKDEAKKMIRNCIERYKSKSSGSMRI